jgi:hypothetical protein
VKKCLEPEVFSRGDIVVKGHGFAGQGLDLGWLSGVMHVDEKEVSSVDLKKSQRVLKKKEDRVKIVVKEGIMVGQIMDFPGKTLVGWFFGRRF